MKALSKGRITLIAVVAAAVVEGVVFLVGSHQHASHSPGPLFLFHLPGIMLTVWMDIPDPEALVLIAFTGAVQFFVLFWLGLIIWRRIYGPRKA